MFFKVGVLKNFASFTLNTVVGTTLHMSKLYAMLPEKLQTILHKKNPVQFCLNTLGATLHRSKPYAIISERLQAAMHKKKSCAKLS